MSEQTNQANGDGGAGESPPAAPLPEEVQAAAAEQLRLHNEQLEAARQAIGMGAPDPTPEPISLNPQPEESEDGQTQQAESIGAATQAVSGADPTPDPDPQPWPDAQQLEAARNADPAATVNPAEVPPVAPGNVIPMPTKPKGGRKKSRAEVKAKKEARSAPVDFWLPVAEEWVRIRDLPFTERVMLQGIPAQLRGEVDAAIRNETLHAMLKGGTATGFSVEEALGALDASENMLNAIAIAAFVEPRLVLTEAEIPAGSDDVWTVDDLHDDDKTAVFVHISRNRDADTMAKGGATAVAGFPGAGLGSAEDRSDSDAVRETAV